MPGPPSAAPEIVSPPASVTAEIRRRVVSDLGPARGASTTRRWAIGMAVIATTLLVVRAALARDDAPTLAVALGGTGLIGLAAFMGLAWRPPGSAGAPRGLLAAWPWVAMMLLFSFIHRAYPESLRGAAWSAHLGCGLRGVLFALLPAAVLFTLWRRTDPFSPVMKGAALGGLAGLVGSVAVSTTCLCADWLHLTAGHGVSVALGTIAGGWVGRRVISP